MDEEKISIILAVAIFLVSVPILLRARGVVRTRSAGWISRVAGASGLEELDPDGPRMLPLFEWGSVLDPGSGHSVVSAIGGSYGGYEVILAEVEEDADRGGAGRLGPPWKSRRYRRRPGASDRWTGPRGLADHLVVFFVEPVPKLPDFRIEPRSPRGRSTGPGSSPWDSTDGDDPSEPLTIVPVEARRKLPEAFLDRAARVLIGRRQSWAIEGAVHRLTVRVSGWRPRSNVRSYWAVLDDALSLREALANFTEVPDPTGEARSIRTSLERIRGASLSPLANDGPGEGDS